MPDNETLKLDDMIRGQVEFNTSLVDDKVLLKADNMPTYHLAVVVDDFLMQITHAFRGRNGFQVPRYICCYGDIYLAKKTCLHGRISH